MPLDQAAVFRRLRYRLARNGLVVQWQTARLRLITMIGTSALVAGFVFALAWFGFREMFANKVPFKGLIVAGLFDLLFFTLGGMLTLSTGIILYASLFTSPETRYLLTTPARADRIFAVKFQAAIAFSSWAFIVLGVPILLAYGLIADVPWTYFLVLPFFLLGFVLLPGAVSSLAMLAFVRFAPRNRRAVLVMIIVALLAALAVWGLRTLSSFRQSVVSGKRDEVENLIGQFALAQSPLIPSHWMTGGLMAAARDDLPASLLALAQIWSNGLILFVIAAAVAKRVYRPAFNRLAGSGFKRTVYGSSLLDRLMEWSVFYLDKPTRILIVKDFRTFRRDPTQWVLLILFAAMMLLGGINFRSTTGANLAAIDSYVLGMVNLAASGVLLCAGLSRFVFPLMSLEGRKFWILGLLPIARSQILKGKFAFAATGAVVILLSLILASDLMLGIPPWLMLCHAVAAMCVALALAGINVGLGAYLPNFRETDPSKIVVGFGGTVNMVIGLMVMLLLLLIAAGPPHAAVAVARLRGQPETVSAWAFAGLPVAIVLSLIAMRWPMKLGGRALETVEF